MTISLSRRSLLIRSAGCMAGAHVAGLWRLWGADTHSKPGVQMYMFAAEYKRDPAGTLARLALILLSPISMLEELGSDSRRLEKSLPAEDHKSQGLVSVLLLGAFPTRKNPDFGAA